MTDLQIDRLTALTVELDDLATLLHDCVHDGASIGFVLPFSRADARAYWANKIAPGVAAGGRVMLTARLPDVMNGAIIGTGQLDIDTMPNQPHRAEVMKLMIHPTARRRGVARALMLALFDQARAHGRTLLTLDTRTGDTAEPLYTSLGFEVAGVYPDYALDPFKKGLDATTLMFKRL